MFERRVACEQGSSEKRRVKARSFLRDQREVKSFFLMQFLTAYANLIAGKLAKEQVTGGFSLQLRLV